MLADLASGRAQQLLCGNAGGGGTEGCCGGAGSEEATEVSPGERSKALSLGLGGWRR